LKINPEISAENADLQRKYGVQGYPTVVFLSSEGELISLNSGFQGTKEFSSLMQETLAGEKKFKQLKELIKKTPDDPKANAELALIYAKRGNVEQGQPYIDKALKLDPQNKTGLLPEIHLHTGLHYGQNADGEKAKEYFQKAETHFKTVVEKYSNSASYELALLYLGITYAIQEKHEMALSALEKLENAKDPEVKMRAKQFLNQVKDMMKK
jgi:tetratricopeptide (TPR) repeat protein